VHALIDNVRSGGAEFLLAELADVAEPNGIKLSVASLEPAHVPSPAADRLRRRGIEPAIVPVSSLVSASDLWRVRRHLARRRPHIDLLHTHLGMSDFVGNLAARSLGIPSVATIHANWWPSDRRSRARNQLTSWARRHCTACVVAVSDSAKVAYLAGRRDRPEHVVVVRNGIADRARRGSGQRVRAELGLDHDAVLITMLSKLRPEKNFETGINVAVELRREFPNVRLLIVGDGPHEAAVRSHASRCGDGVRLLGHREDVMEILDATDIVLHPSHFDAFPTTVLEAMAASVPVVATATGGIVEIIENGSCGVLIPSSVDVQGFVTALRPLIADHERRRQMGRAARRRFEATFTADRWAARLRALYDDVLTGVPLR
jgi:glycosyltransferase involved in cell wall biosynthesis